MTFSRKPPEVTNFTLLVVGCWATVLLAIVLYAVKMARG